MPDGSRRGAAGGGRSRPRCSLKAGMVGFADGML